MILTYVNTMATSVLGELADRMEQGIVHNIPRYAYTSRERRSSHAKERVSGGGYCMYIFDRKLIIPSIACIESEDIVEGFLRHVLKNLGNITVKEPHGRAGMMYEYDNLMEHHNVF
jgi:hypothetical protein